eukprot:TRINITY_DN27789_c0_g1_i1.p1 TRINITY_DN27789_c0_g1~~TRINITY_DN27789_c0_g1_i1.p1  ORF type:complete len:191 (+),score=40.62 TRINITY_DN27789_c0_g1_i1:117-689(+)
MAERQADKLRPGATVYTPFHFDPIATVVQVDFPAARPRPASLSEQRPPTSSSASADVKQAADGGAGMRLLDTITGAQPKNHNAAVKARAFQESDWPPAIAALASFMGPLTGQVTGSRVFSPQQEMQPSPPSSPGNQAEDPASPSVTTAMKVTTMPESKQRSIASRGWVVDLCCPNSSIVLPEAKNKEPRR